MPANQESEVQINQKYMNLDKTDLVGTWVKTFYIRNGLPFVSLEHNLVLNPGSGNYFFRSFSVPLRDLAFPPDN